MTSAFDSACAVRGAHSFVRQDGHFAEHLTRAENGQQHGSPRSPPLQMPIRPLTQHVHRVAGLALVVQVRLGRNRHVAASSFEGGSFAFRKRCEEAAIC